MIEGHTMTKGSSLTLVQITMADYEKLQARASYAEGALAGIGFRLRAIIREERPPDRLKRKLNETADDAVWLSHTFAHAHDPNPADCPACKILADDD